MLVYGQAYGAHKAQMRMLPNYMIMHTYMHARDISTSYQLYGRKRM